MPHDVEITLKMVIDVIMVLYGDNGVAFFIRRLMRSQLCFVFHR